MIPPFRRKTRSPYDRQVLGVRVRAAEAATQPIALKLTEPRLKLMRAIAAGEVKVGHGSYANHWRWSGTTVTERVGQLLGADWVHVVAKHVELTEAGRAVLDGAK